MQDASIRFADVERVSFDLLDRDINEVPAADFYLCAVPFGQRIEFQGRRWYAEDLTAQRCLPLISSAKGGLLIVSPAVLTASAFASTRKLIQKSIGVRAIIELARRTVSNRMTMEAALLVLSSGRASKGLTFMGAWDGKNTDVIIRSVAENSGDFFVDTNSLTDRWDRRFHDPAYQETENELGGLETRSLGDMAECIRGDHQICRDAGDVGSHRVVRTANLIEGQIEPDKRDRFIDLALENSNRRGVLRPHDLLLCPMSLKTAMVREVDLPAIANPNLMILRSDESEYINTYFQSESGQDLFCRQAERLQRGTTIARLSTSDLQEIQIPILPIDELSAATPDAIDKAEPSELLELREKLTRVLQGKERLEAKLADERELRLSQAELFAREVTEQLDRKLLPVKQGIDQLQTTLSDVAKTLNAMASDVQTIKQSNRSEDEKLTRMMVQLKRWTKEVEGNRQVMEEYTELVQCWNENWDLMESNSQVYLPSAEHLFDEFEKIDGADYSPFVLQYSRALENELLRKLFIEYDLDLQAREDVFESLTSAEKNDPKTGVFAKMLRSRRGNYTLGNMYRIMQLIKTGGKTMLKSPLLQDFRRFTDQYFEECICDKEFTGQIQTIVDEYRNKAAHPDLIDRDRAIACQQLVRSSLIALLGAYRRDK